MDHSTTCRKVSLGDTELQYILTRKSVKNINLRIKLDGQVCVSASPGVPVSYIDAFIIEKSRFILNALDQYEHQRNSTPLPKQYVSGERFAVLENELELKVTESQEESVESDGLFIFLSVRDKRDIKRKEKLMDDWYQKLEIEVFDEICKDTYEKFKRFDIVYPKIKIRSMKSRWGSCQTQKGVITLNRKLIEYPRRNIEYVVLHEFAHFIHPNHSKEFYQFIEMLMPDWKERKRGL